MRYHIAQPYFLPSIMVLGLALVSVGCLTVPTEENFRNMESRATILIPQIEHLPRYDPGDSWPAAKLRHLQADDLTVDDVVRMALSNNPRIQAEYERLDMAAADQLASRLLKNPELKGSLIMSEEDASKNAFEVEVEMDLLHLILLPKRRRLGAADYATVEMEVARAVQRLAFDARVAYFRLLAAQQRLALRETVLQTADAGREMAQRIRDAGNIKELDRLNREALYEQAALDVSAANLAVTEAREALNLLMGVYKGDAPWQTSASLPEPSDEEFEQGEVLANALENSVELALTRNRIQAAAQRLGIARMESAIPALHVGVIAERETDGEWFVGPMITVELPLFDFGQADRPFARASLRKLRHEYAAKAVEIAATTRTAAMRASVAAERARRYKESILPLRRQIMHHTQLQYNAMQLGVFELLQAKEMEIESNNAYVNELLDYWIARIELEQIRQGLLVEMDANAPASLNVQPAGRGNREH